MNDRRGIAIALLLLLLPLTLAWEICIESSEGFTVISKHGECIQTGKYEFVCRYSDDVLLDHLRVVPFSSNKSPVDIIVEKSDNGRKIFISFGNRIDYSSVKIKFGDMEKIAKILGYKVNISNVENIVNRMDTEAKPKVKYYVVDGVTFKIVEYVNAILIDVIRYTGRPIISINDRLYTVDDFPLVIKGKEVTIKVVNVRAEEVHIEEKKTKLGSVMLSMSIPTAALVSVAAYYASRKSNNLTTETRPLTRRTSSTEKKASVKRFLNRLLRSEEIIKTKYNVYYVS